MIKHIVMWNFKKEVVEGEKELLKAKMEENLTALVGKVPGLLDAEFVRNPITSSTHDMALLTTFDSVEALKGYKDHPEHVHVANTYVRPYTTERCCMDYEMVESRGRVK